MINKNQNLNKPAVSDAVLKKLGILKVLNAIVSEDEETKYRCVTENGEIKLFTATELQIK